jgi:hypothetical protein
MAGTAGIIGDGIGGIAGNGGANSLIAKHQLNESAAAG